MNLINLSNPKSKRTEHYCSAGKKDKIVYKYVYDEKHGCPRRVENGKIDLQEMIQSYADDVDFKALGKMLIANKENVMDHFVLNDEVQDVTNLPRNIHEYEALHNKMMAEFDKLPEDLKNLFGNDFGQFSSAWKSNTIGSVLDTYYKSQASTESAEAVTSEKGE